MRGRAGTDDGVLGLGGVGGAQARVITGARWATVSDLEHLQTTVASTPGGTAVVMVSRAGTAIGHVLALHSTAAGDTGLRWLDPQRPIGDRVIAAPPGLLPVGLGPVAAMHAVLIDEHGHLVHPDHWSTARVGDESFVLVTGPVPAHVDAQGNPLLGADGDGLSSWPADGVGTVLVASAAHGTAAAHPAPVSVTGDAVVREIFEEVGRRLAGTKFADPDPRVVEALVEQAYSRLTPGERARNTEDVKHFVYNQVVDGRSTVGLLGGAMRRDSAGTNEAARLQSWGVEAAHRRQRRSRAIIAPSAGTRPHCGDGGGGRTAANTSRHGVSCA